MIIGICSGSRAKENIRIGHDLLHHSRHILMFAGNTLTYSSTAASAADRRVRRGSSKAPMAISAIPDA